MNFNIIKLPNYKLVRHFSLNVCENQKKNYYDCLGITPKATQGAVKTAYYKLSKQYHPDVNKDNPSAADKFRDVAEAYEVLGNLRSRRLYDSGMVFRGIEDSYSESNKPDQENYKHASFYQHRNDSTTNTRRTHKIQHFDMDEWTRAHYSETFSSSFQRKQSGDKFVKDKIGFKKETQIIVHSIFVLVALVFIMVNEANASVKFDHPSIEREMKIEDPD